MADSTTSDSTTSGRRTAGRKASDSTTSDSTTSGRRTSGRKASDSTTSDSTTSGRRTAGRKASDSTTSGRRTSGRKAADKKKSKKKKRGLQNFDRIWSLNRALDLFWQQGYVPASIELLCKTLNLKSHQLYDKFKNKPHLFFEAITHYEQNFWDEPARSFRDEPDVYKAVADFFEETVRTLVTPEVSCSSMIVVAAWNIEKREKAIIQRVSSLRQATLQLFTDRLERARAEGQLPEDCDTRALASGLNTFLEGVALQARDGLILDELLPIARLAVSLLPPPQA